MSGLSATSGDGPRYLVRVLEDGLGLRFLGVGEAQCGAHAPMAAQLVLSNQAAHAERGRSRKD